MRVYIVGHKGWIGQMFVKQFEKYNVEVYFSEFRGESKEIKEDILNKKPTHLLCCLGRTHGVLGDKKYTTIDYLQNPETLHQNINDNLFVPLNLALFCQKHNIHFTYLGTGCIYNYENDKNLFDENDIPNFFGSNYSIVKGFTNMLMNELNALHLRIRMPITSQKNPRNFITKILSYSKICSISNSMSILDELIPIAICMMKENILGVYNFTNPNVISHNEILEMYREILDKDFVWENFTLEEQNQTLLSKRSNNHLDTSKLENTFVLLKEKYPELILNPIKEGIRKCLSSYK
jgi:3,5-epimerase/4-reductase